VGRDGSRLRASQQGHGPLCGAAYGHLPSARPAAHPQPPSARPPRPSPVPQASPSKPAEGVGTCCLYFRAPSAPFPDNVLYLNGEGAGVVNNACFPSTVAPSYAPPGQVGALWGGLQAGAAAGGGRG
jgi:hypothetical protein